ncbi:MAG TPA: PRC-barrel domain-containing protein [Flavisolibacter sp.]|jgi:sporulation protein YlmC with PRC-barrel domain|nr:PRC-barrel domain-containing protein [Flavisolibacter sp.]
MENMKHRRLQELDRSDFGVIKGESDIRGWDVRNSSGRKIGEVEELIVDAQERKVRYMVVDLKDNELDLKKHKVLIPIGLAELDKNDDDVLLPSVSLEQLRHLPTYDLNILDDTTERLICVALGREEDLMDKDRQSEKRQQADRTDYNEDFYGHSYFADDNLYKNRLHEAQPASSDRRADDERRLRLLDRDDERMDHERRERELDEERRLEMVRNRRRMYQDRRGSSRDSDRYRDDDNDLHFR